MNAIMTMAQVAKRLGMTGPDLCRRTRRRLAQIAETRHGVQLFRLGKRHWHTTEEDLRRLLPELFTHEDDDAESLRPVIEQLVAEVRALKQRTATLENQLFSLARGHKMAPGAAQGAPCPTLRFSTPRPSAPKISLSSGSSAPAPSSPTRTQGSAR